jgi:hypothetical protein
MLIQGIEFSGFPGRDSLHLRTLDHAGRVEWFGYRFNLVFLTPFRRLVELEGPDCYVWLCVMELAGAAIHALANLAVGHSSDHAKFTTFVNTYLPTFAATNLRLDDPRGDRRNGTAMTSADHFYKYFRNGLAHTFCIEWGGLQHREELPGLGASYLFQTTQSLAGEHGLGIVPREFVREFENGCERILTAFAAAKAGDALREAFERTFERVFLTKARAPLP